MSLADRFKVSDEKQIEVNGVGLAFTGILYINVKKELKVIKIM